jgi:hypothetical protein
MITSQIGLDDAQEEQEQNKLASKRAMTVNMLAPRKRRNVACNLGFHVTSCMEWTYWDPVSDQLHLICNTPQWLSRQRMAPSSVLAL